jgi:TrmH family RNA methyltransferase
LAEPLDLDRVQVVLVRPEHPGNVAAACRALVNMGLSRLILVEPAPGFREPAARALAYGAWDVLDGALEMADLGEALRDCGSAVGTSGKQEGWTPRELAEQAPGLQRRGPLALVFGPERSGLRTDELALCDHQVRIPSHPTQPSLNLAQAVLILAYELSVAGHRPSARPALEPARHGEIEQALAELRGGLLGIGYLDAANPGRILGELRRLLRRSAPTSREVVLLRGLARQLRWAAGRLRDAR